ncbi:MAG: hypothetical protein Q8J66_00935 [Methylotenera sp.]|nr:hypothetical protein [Methylotenera sp.]
MSIFLRKKLSSNFTTLPNSLIRDPNLSWKATGFLAYLLSCADGWELNFADLSKRKKDGESATRAAAVELKEAGYLQINKMRDERGRIIGYEWVVSNQPELQTPDVDSPNVDFPHLENRGQRKNNSKSNSFNKQQPQQHKPAEQSCGGGDLIFDKNIKEEYKVDLIKVLAGVENEKAQAALDELAAGLCNKTVKIPAAWLQFVIKNGLQRTPEGLIISSRRKNENREIEKRRVENEATKQPRNVELAEKYKAKRIAMGIK